MFVLRVLVFALGALLFGFMVGALVYAAENRSRRMRRTLGAGRNEAAWDEHAAWKEALLREDEARAGELLQKLTSEGAAILEAERRRA